MHRPQMGPPNAPPLGPPPPQQLPPQHMQQMPPSQAPPPLMTQPTPPPTMGPNANQMPIQGPPPAKSPAVPAAPSVGTSPAPPQMNGTQMPPVSEPSPNPAMSQQQINAYQGMMAQLQQQKQSKITPIAKPQGIDPIEVLKERENRISQRIAHRINQLLNLPANMPEDLRTKAMIELRALRLLNFQKQLRQEVVSDELGRKLKRTILVLFFFVASGGLHEERHYTRDRFESKAIQEN